jgi:hypothetical protein
MAKTKEPAKPKTTTKKPEKTARKPPVKKTARKEKKTDKLLKVIRYCSFCGRPSNELMALIAGPNNIFICDNCLEVCVAILLDDENPNKDTPKMWRERINNVLAKSKICEEK